MTTFKVDKIYSELGLTFMIALLNFMISELLKKIYIGVNFDARNPNEGVLGGGGGKEDLTLNINGYISP